MALLMQIVKTMNVEPELLEELTKEQKEMLFHLIREEQLRRMISADREYDAKHPPRPRVPKLTFAPYAELWETEDDDEVAKRAAKRVAELEKKREKAEMEEDERQARILAEIEVQQQLERQRIEAEQRAAEIKRLEEEEKARLEAQAAKDKEESAARELYMTMKEARLAGDREAKARKEREDAAKKAAESRKKELERLEAEQKKAEAAAKKVMASMSKEIYESMQEVRAKAKKVKQDEETKMEKLFQQQEQAAKAAEEEKRQAALRAREEAKKTADSASILQAMEARRQSEAAEHAKAVEAARMQREASRRDKKPVKVDAHSASSTSIVSSDMLSDGRPARPTSDQMVIDWWRRDEMSRRAGMGPDGKYYKWFHGLISRQDSEQLLQGQPLGAYLVRVSARIWGYTISFVDEDRYKHFLIDVVEGKYSVFGVEARSHKDLYTLVKFHESVAISKSGTKLTKPIGDANGNRSLAALLQ